MVILLFFCFVFFKKKTAYELRIGDWSSDVCSSDLQAEQVIRVHDPIAAGRRAALRAVAVQGLVVALLAAAFLAQGVREALAVGVGGLALVLGNALSAVVALGGIVPAPVAFGRLLLGAMGKWLVAIAVLAAALAIWRLPPLPVLVGLVAGLLAYLLALKIGRAHV